MKFNPLDISPNEICVRLNRFSIESILACTFYFGLKSLSYIEKEARLAIWRDNPNSHPWNINSLFNLTLLKNFKQPEKDIDLEEASFLLNACWENFNKFENDVTKQINPMMHHEVIFQQYYKIYSLRNIFFLKKNKMNSGIKIISNEIYKTIIDPLICAPYFIDFCNGFLNQYKINSLSIHKKVYINLLDKIGVLEVLTNNFSNMQKYFKNESDKLKAMLTWSPLFNWPIVEYKESLFIPCPQMIIMSTSYSLINKVSYEVPDKDKTLSDTMERYVFNIINSNANVDAIWKEFEYGTKRKRKNTSDIIFRIDNTIVFCECKLKRASNEFRQFNVAKIDLMIDEIAEDFMQLYKSMIDYKTGELLIENEGLNKRDIRGKLIIMESIPQLLIDFSLGKFKENCEKGDILIYEKVINQMSALTLYELEDTALRGGEIMNLFGFTLMDNSNNSNSFFEELEIELDKVQDDVLSKDDFAQFIMDSLIIKN